MSEQTTSDGAESPIIVERLGRVGHIQHLETIGI